MPDLLLELFSEEIPARMQAKAAEDLKKLVTDAFVNQGVLYEGASAYSTPRRLTLTVHGLPARQPDTREERKGPRVGAPEAAIQGFLKSAGLTSPDEAKIVSDPKKGEFYIALIEKPGRPLPDLVAEIIPGVIRNFPWPKSMRWGRGTLRWVRPLRSIVCTFGPETEDPAVVDFDVDGIKSGDMTYGHRFMAPAPIRVKRFADYAASLQAGKVVLDAARRRDIILTDARNLAFAQGLELVEDEAVLHETAALVEWPVVMMGSFDPDFLSIPDEAIQATIRVNQKCFVVRDPRTSRLANRFILVSNIEPSQDDTTIVAGNERVIRARLADAKFFWETDQKSLPGFEGRGNALEQRLAKIVDSNVVFHEKLGTQGERVNRIVNLAVMLAPAIGADPALTHRAAQLAKADLATGMVGEFPELQGLMGRYYALAAGEDIHVAAAIEDHYRPKGAGDRIPGEPVAIAVALADKLDILCGFWSIDEKPTGSKDPYALRRAALGVIRILLENRIRLPLAAILASHLAQTLPGNRHALVKNPEHLCAGLMEFFADRLKIQLREQGARHDLVDAVFSLGGQDDLVVIVSRIEALGRFLASEDGGALLAGVRRAANIVRIEEKKDALETYGGGASPLLLIEPVEKALYEALKAARGTVDAAVSREDFEGAMEAIASLRQPVDAFFNTILVNCDDRDLRLNRLRLLEEIRAATRTVADFSKIEG